MCLGSKLCLCNLFSVFTISTITFAVKNRSGTLWSPSFPNAGRAARARPRPWLCAVQFEPLRKQLARRARREGRECSEEPPHVLSGKLPGSEKDWDWEETEKRKLEPAGAVRRRSGAFRQPASSQRFLPGGGRTARTLALGLQIGLRDGVPERPVHAARTREC